MTTKAIFQMKIKHIFVSFFGKPVSKCVALFRLRCLLARKRCKVSLNLGDLWWFCLLFSTNKRYCCWYFIKSCILFVCWYTSQRHFSAILWRTQLVCSCWSAPTYHHFIIRFLINVQVQGQHPHQWAPFQIAGLLHAWLISHQISRYVYHEGW